MNGPVYKNDKQMICSSYDDELPTLDQIKDDLEYTKTYKIKQISLQNDITKLRRAKYSDVILQLKHEIESRKSKCNLITDETYSTDVPEDTLRTQLQELLVQQEKYKTEQNITTTLKRRYDTIISDMKTVKQKHIALYSNYDKSSNIEKRITDMKSGVGTTYNVQNLKTFMIVLNYGKTIVVK